MSKSGTFTPSSNNTTTSLLDAVQCPTGTQALGGGGSAQLAVGNVAVGSADLVSSAPNSSGSAWQTGYAKRDGSFFTTNDQLSYISYVVCANVTK